MSTTIRDLDVLRVGIVYWRAYITILRNILLDRIVLIGARINSCSDARLCFVTVAEVQL